MAGALGMMLVLPGRKDAPIRALGAIVLVAGVLVLAALLAKRAAGMSAQVRLALAVTTD